MKALVKLLGSDDDGAKDDWTDPKGKGKGKGGKGKSTYYTMDDGSEVQTCWDFNEWQSCWKTDCNRAHVDKNTGRNTNPNACAKGKGKGTGGDTWKAAAAAAAPQPGAAAVGTAAAGGGRRVIGGGAPKAEATAEMSAAAKLKEELKDVVIDGYGLEAKNEGVEITVRVPLTVGRSCRSATRMGPR